MNIIMVIGLPGTGKTTFAESLAAALSAKHLNTDVIRDAMGKRGKYDAVTKAAIYDELLHQTETELQGGKNVVVDGTFYRKQLREPYVQLAQRYGASIFWMEIKAAENIIRTRVSQRRAYSEADFTIYLKIKSQYEPLEAPHLELWSDQLELATMIERAINYINAAT